MVTFQWKEPLIFWRLKWGVTVKGHTNMTFHHRNYLSKPSFLFLFFIYLYLFILFYLLVTVLLLRVLGYLPFKVAKGKKTYPTLELGLVNPNLNVKSGHSTWSILMPFLPLPVSRNHRIPFSLRIKLVSLEAS